MSPYPPRNRTFMKRIVLTCCLQFVACRTIGTLPTASEIPIEQTPIVTIPFQATGTSLFYTPTLTLFEQIVDHSVSLSPSFYWGQVVQIEELSFSPIIYQKEREYSVNNQVFTAPPGAIFLWIQIKVENVSQNAESPLFICELHNQGEKIYASELGVKDNWPSERYGFDPDKLYPGQFRDGWILFEVPEIIDLNQAYLLVRPILSRTDYYAWRFESQ